MPLPFINRIRIISVVSLLTLLAGACGGGGNFTALTANNPIAQVPEGLAVSASSAALTEAFGVQISAISAEAFLNGQSGNQAQIAIERLPANRHLRGSVFELNTSGNSPQGLYLSIIVPAGIDPAASDLFAWDGATWTFLPARVQGGQLVAQVAQLPSAVALFEAALIPPLAFATIEPGQTLTAEATGAINGLLLGGVTVNPDGTLGGQLPNLPSDQSLALYPLIRYSSDVLTDPAVRATHQQMLLAFAASAPYAGLALDGRASTSPLVFAQFAVELARQLRAQDRTLLVFADAPPRPDSALADPTYWRALSLAADALLVSLPSDPTIYGSGAASQMMAWVVSEVERSRLRLVTSALSVDGDPNGFTLRDYASALAPLGSASVTPETGSTALAGQPITLTLSGKVQTLEFDALASAARYTYSDEAGTPHTVWLTSPGTLRQRLTLAEKYRLGGVMVSDLFTPGMSSGMAEAVTQYKVNLAAQALTQAGLVWTVSSAGSVVAQATAQPGQPYIYVAQTPGDYQFSAEFQYDNPASLGSVALSVAEAPSPTPVPTTVATASTGSTGSSGSSGNGGNSGSGDGPGVFVPPPPISAGTFELGGQVPSFIAHPAQMQQAGMKWVKFQAIGDAAGLVSAGKGAGFKVLLSAVGDRARAADPSYWPEYAAWVAGLAAAGADAIEVWNEANIDREWPTGQISGATYTELLKQAYNAIKAANSSTMVISGAPAPTGAEGAFPGSVVNDDNFLRQMANAGAASYMDCVGIHFNTGTTSPNDTSGSALSGYHYSYYFWPMVNLYYDSFGGTRPLCFTELGYVSPEGYESVPLPGNFGWAAGTSVAEQAQWLAESASLSAGSGKVRLMVVFNVDFTVYLSNDPQAGYAMIRPNGSCPACASLDAVMP
jgi:hypothetical protein